MKYLFLWLLVINLHSHKGLGRTIVKFMPSLITFMYFCILTAWKNVTLWDWCVFTQSLMRWILTWMTLLSTKYSHYLQCIQDLAALTLGDYCPSFLLSNTSVHISMFQAAAKICSCNFFTELNNAQKCVLWLGLKFDVMLKSVELVLICCWCVVSEFERGCIWARYIRKNLAPNTGY